MKNIGKYLLKHNDREVSVWASAGRREWVRVRIIDTAGNLYESGGGASVLAALKALDRKIAGR